MKKSFLLIAALVMFIFGANSFAQNVEVSTGGPVTNYTTLKAAFDAINAGTHTGVILIEFATGSTETAPAVLNSSGAGSASYTSITIRPRVDGIVVTSSYSTSGRGLVELNGADNVTIDGDNPNTVGTNRNLTFTNGAANTTTYNSVIRLALSILVTTANTNTVKNCILNGSATGMNVSSVTSTTTSANTTYGILVGGGASTVAVTTAPSAITSVTATISGSITVTSLTLDNNFVTTCARGIAVQGSATTVASGLTVTNNFIGSSVAGSTSTVYSMGITVQGSSNAIIRLNTVKNMGSFLLTGLRGIDVGSISTGVSGATIERNTVETLINNNTGSYGAYGISLGGGSTHIVQNNFVTGVRNDQTSGSGGFSTTYGAFGIRIGSGTGHKIYYNSVNLYGAMSGAVGTDLLTCIGITSTSYTGCDVRNNIFANTMTGGNASGTRFVCAYLPSSATVSMALTWNNNAYFGGTDANARLGQVGTTYGTGEYTVANFNPGSTSPSTNFRAYTSPLSAAGTNDNASFATTSAAPFTSSTNLHIPTSTVTQLESGGTPITGLTTDIDAETRNATTPDIGADEFVGTGIDLTAPGISYTDLASTCSTGDVTLSPVTITDATGVPTSGSLVPRIYYKKNAGSYFSQPGTLITGTGTSGTWSFPIVVADMGGVTGLDVISYFVIAQDMAGTPNIGSNPSGVVATDVNTITTPPTPKTYSIGVTLSGDYLVGTGQTFTTLTAAVNAYNSACGLSGPVRFLLNDATYSGETLPITINSSPYSSATNTLTILPNTGVTATITGSNSNSIIKLNGADYVIIDGSNNGSSSRNLSLINTNTSGSGVWIGSASASNGATNNIVKNVIITGTAGTTNVAGILIGSGTTLGGAAESPNDNLTIQNNLITKFQNGLYNSGNATTYDQNLLITQNTFGSVTVAEKLGYRGLLVLNMQNVTISNNTVMGVTTSTTSTSTGIAVGNNISGGNIYGNKISDIKNTNTGGYGTNGIQLGATSTASALNIYNNFIWDIAGYGYASGAGIADNGYGIIVVQGGGYNIYYNSVSLVTNQTVNGLPSAINITSGVTTAGSVNLKNNIFSNTQTTGTNRYAIYCGALSSVFASIDYNDYYAGTAPNLGFIGSNRATLTDIQTGFGSNLNSKSVIPLFTSATDLHLQAASTLDASATPIAGITTDIDGAVRNALTPDMGADEFTGSDLTGPTITYTALTNTSSTSNRAFGSVTITDLSGVQVIPTGQPKCYYKRSGDLNEFNDNTSGTDGWKYVDCNGATSPFDFTIDYSLLFGGGGVSFGNVVQYFVTAEDMAGTPNVSINSGSFAAPQTTCLLGATAFPIGGSINSYEIVGAPLSGSYTVGTTMFRQLTGRNIEERLMTRKVKKLVPVESLNRPVVNKSAIEQNSSNSEKEAIGYMTMNRYAVSGKMIEIEVEEVYSEMFENGKKYTGDQYAKYTGNSEALMGDYATLSAAISDLNNRGVSGPVTFILIDGSYAISSTLTINDNISGISSSNSVTIKPQTGVSPVLTGTIGSNALLTIKSSYVTIDGSNSGGTSRDMQFVNNSTTSPLCLLIGSTGTTTLTQTTVKNCVLTGGGSLVLNAQCLTISDGSTIGNPGYFSNITVQNNKIEKCEVGIFSNATTGSSLAITGNTLTSSGLDAVGYCGIYTQGFDGVTISGNEAANFDGTGFEDDPAIWLASGTKNAVVEKNNIHSISYTGTGGYGPHGIDVTSGTASCNITVKNNIIYDLTGDGYVYTSTTYGSDNPIGIQVGNAGTVTQSGINIYNNTIRLTGSTLNQTDALSMGIRIGAGATVVDVRNNLVVNNLGLLAATGLGAVGLHVRTSSTQLSACDNNCYYINPTAGAKNFGRISTTGQTTLAGWRTATGKETVSFSSNPVFVSGTDYHITAVDLSVSGRGTYIASVTDDYDGNPRATSQSSSLRPVDVGADQYTPAGYSGNVLTPAVSGIGVYYDGDLRAVEIESLTGTIGGIKQYPGVQTPNNVLRPIDRNNNTQEKINSKPLNKDGKLNNKKKDGTSGGNTSGEAVNTPWIYWKLTGMTDGTYGTFRFYYNEDQLAGITESVLRLSYWDPNANTWENSFSQSVNVSGNYIQVTFPTGMDWDNTEAIFAVEDPATPLPVVLESFDVSVRNRDAGLNWVTSYELNNKGFGIERKVKSEGGYTAWKEIGFVNGNGTSNKGFAYSYTDRKLNKGSYQYRLRQVDYNGNAEYFSPTNTGDIVVGNPSVFDLGQNYPNPSNPKSKIDFQMPFDGKVSIKVYDLLGREVATLADGIKTADFYTVEFDGSNLASGTYFYRIIAESGTEKFTKTLKIVLVK